MDAGQLLSSLAALLAAFVAAIAAKRLASPQEKSSLTIELFNAWHSAEMYRFRMKAWSWLNDAYRDNPVPYHRLFCKRGLRDNPEAVEAVTKILYFWHLYYVTKKNALSAHEIRTELFKYQYVHWLTALRPLYEITVEDGTDSPEWLAMFEDEEITWHNGAASLPGVKINTAFDT